MNVQLYTSADLPPVNRREVFRYARAGNPSETENALLDQCLAELLPSLTYRTVWAEYPVIRDSEALDLIFARVNSSDLAKNLRGCNRIVLFAATVGIAPDRLAQKYSRISPVKALFLESVGNERIEALCDLFCGEFENTRPRFSPGYGDLPLDLQREILSVLDCPRKIGLTLNESLLMTPSKSVTAIMGIKA
ncbi:MAG: Vitamin B12 dependent methionine synthase activation subunit [Clostridia bacterium]|nr:Vitamin B12 dependent methionine synthase activation subunit [Clostridia bacterium]